MENKILICEGNFSATLAAVRSFGRHNLKVVVADSTSLSISKFSKYIYQSVKCPNVRYEENFISWIVNSAKKGIFDIFFPTSDLLMWYTLKYKKVFNKYMKIKIPNKKSLEIALFKDLTYKYCQKFNVPYPTSFYPHSKDDITEFAGRIKYPVLVKHRTHTCLNNKRKGYILWYKSLTEKVIPLKNPKVNVDRIYCDLTSDFINFPSQLFLRKNSINIIKEYFTTLPNARSFAVFDLDDILPFFINVLIEFKDVFLHPRGFVRNTIKGE